MPAFVDVSGQTFGHWTVIGPYQKVKGRIRWPGRCACGTERLLDAHTLRNGTSVSCGCIQTAALIKRATTHGMSHSRIWKIYQGMKSRCTNQNIDTWEHYGARGIKLCESWMASFENFLADMGPTYSAGMTIERVNVDGNYEPGNCIWLPKEKQTWNRTNTILLDTPWGKMHLSEAARRAGIKPHSLYYRVVTMKWPPEDWFIPIRKDTRHG